MSDDDDDEDDDDDDDDDDGIEAIKSRILTEENQNSSCGTANEDQSCQTLFVAVLKIPVRGIRDCLQSFFPT